METKLNKIYSFRIDNETYTKFSNKCNTSGHDKSSVLRALIIAYLEGD